MAKTRDNVAEADATYQKLLNDGAVKPEDVLAYIQRHVIVGKGNRNDFAGFNYRTLGDIHDALQPWLDEQMSCITYSEAIQECGGHVYVVSTCTLHTPYGDISATSPARDAIQKTKSDAAQITGMSVTYSRKYAAGGLFKLDTERDPDALPPEEEAPTYPEGQFYAQCSGCGQVYGPMDKHTAPVTYCGTCQTNDWQPMPAGWQPGMEVS